MQLLQTKLMNASIYSLPQQEEFVYDLHRSIDNQEAEGTSNPGISMNEET